MKTPAHRHRLHTKTHDKPFNHCVNPYACCEEAHGCITFTATCRCGATCDVNINQRWIETGPWKEKQT